MQWKKLIRWSAVALAILIVVLVGALLFLRTATFRQYVLRKVEHEAAQSTGARVQVGSLDLNLTPLTVKLRNIVVRGTESDTEPPLLRADELIVGIGLRSLLHREVNLGEVLIQHPVVHIRASRTGANNLPLSPPSQRQSHTNIFDLAIAHFAITNGEINYNDRKTPLDATIEDLHTEVMFHSATTAYTGFISYSNGQFAYAQYAALPHHARLQFMATPSVLSLESAVLTTGSSVISLKGELKNFSNPIATVDYEIHLHPQDFAAFYSGTKAEGQVHLSGTLDYTNTNNQPFLRNVVIHGYLDSRGISAATTAGRFDLRALQSHYELANGELQTHDFVLDTLGGRITADADVRHLDTTPAFHVRTAFHDVSLRDIQRSVKAGSRDQIAIAGTLSGSANAFWTGSTQNIRVQSDLTVRGGARSAAGNSATVYVDAVLHALYDGPSAVLTIRSSNLNTPSLALTADGQVSKSSSLKIHAHADNLHELLQIVSSFNPSKSGLPALSGSATLDTTIHGSLHSPQISGQLNVANLNVEGSEWKSAAVSFTVSPSGISVSESSLVNANQGRVSVKGNIVLSDWRYDARNPIRAELSAQKLALGDLQRIAHVQYPLSGDLSASLSLKGTQLDPAGSGSLEVANGHVYGEPVQTFRLKFNADNGSVTSNLNVATNAGAATSTFTYTPSTRAYKIKLDAPSIALQKIHRLQSSQGLKATVSASVNGEGTVDNPQLTAVIHVAQLEVQQKSLGDLNANLQVADKRANLNLDSQLSQTSIRAHAQVELSGDFQTDAAIDTNAIPLGTLWASLSPGAPEGFQGQTELHATLKGPLKDKTRLEAHVTIPTLTASYQQLQIGSAAPIRADYVNSVITLQPAEIRGTDTSLQLQGSVPLVGSANPSLSGKGQIDMQILRMFAPDLRSSGTISIDLHAAGSPRNPALQGQIRLHNVGMSTPESPIGIDQLNGLLDIDNSRVQVSQTTAQVGSGQVSVGGAVTYRPSLQFALAVQGKSIRLRYPQGLRSVLDSNLSLSGNLQSASLNGRVLIDSLSFTPDFDLSTFGDQFTSSTATPPQAGFADNLQLNVSVQSKQNLSATSSQVSVEGGVNLNVAGTAADPVITGRTELTSGELFYRGNRYQLQRGVITFADPNRTNPNLNVSVATTVEQYNLTMNLRGTLDRLTTSYSSDPPLSTTDIIHLIAFGNTSSEAAASNASQSTDAMLATSAAGAGLTSGVQKLAGFSSLQIDPLLGGNNQNPSARIAVQQRVTKNFLFTFSTDVSQPGQEIVQGDYQITPRWSVNVTRDQLGGVTVAGRLHTKF